MIIVMTTKCDQKYTSDFNEVRNNNFVILLHFLSLTWTLNKPASDKLETSWFNESFIIAPASFGHNQLA